MERSSNCSNILLAILVSFYVGMAIMSWEVSHRDTTVYLQIMSNLVVIGPDGDFLLPFHCLQSVCLPWPPTPERNQASIHYILPLTGHFLFLDCWRLLPESASVHFIVPAALIKPRNKPSGQFHASQVQSVLKSSAKCGTKWVLSPFQSYKSNYICGEAVLYVGNNE